MSSRKQKIRRIRRMVILFRILLVSLLIGGILLTCYMVKNKAKNEGMSGKERQSAVVEQTESLGGDITTFEPEQETTNESDVDLQQSDDTNVIQIDLSEDVNESVPKEEIDTSEEELEKSVEDELKKLSLNQKIAQLFFVTPEQLTGVQRVVAAGNTTKEALKKTTVGGVIYFAENLESPEQTKEMLLNTQNFAKLANGLPIFMAIDEEGGRVLRVGSNAAFGVPKVPAMGEVVTGGREAVYESASTIGTYLSELHFNTDFAPDADVITNPSNQVIGNRSFGSDPNLVAQMAWTYVQGLHDHNILASYKHFPGHGGTEEDTHAGYAYLNRSMEEIKKNELVPFLDAAKRDVDFIMVSHICVPQITEGDVPASLSKELVTDLLREELGYKGIIITDSLRMGAVSEHYSAGDAAKKAIMAGCDMILMPADFHAAYKAVLQAVQDGEIAQSQIDASVRRILRVKLMKLAGNATS